jgi:hypothetical protein
MPEVYGVFCALCKVDEVYDKIQRAISDVAWHNRKYHGNKPIAKLKKRI